MCLPADETKQAGAGRGNSRKIKKDPKAGKMSNLTSHQSNAYLNKNTLGAFCLGPVLGGPLHARVLGGLASSSPRADWHWDQKLSKCV